MYKVKLGELANDYEGKDESGGYAETDPTGRYGRLEEVLGKGAMKTVYKAIDEALGMEVAWNQAKLNEVLQSPDALQRLYSEVHLLSTLNHDSIIQFYTSWIDVERKTFNFITEFFTSGTLREYRRKYKRVDIRAIKGWARQILKGLVYLHGHDPPVIHRDLKCDNIFVNGHLGEVKIGDLGLAAILRGSQSAHSVIGINLYVIEEEFNLWGASPNGPLKMLLRTPEFMAPELYEENYNELVDVYSFGMCVLEMLTSEYPYSECSNPAQIYKKVTSGKLPGAFYRIQDLEAQSFIGKCLVTASKRLPAKELLLDPFLASDTVERPSRSKPGSQKPFLNDIRIEKLRLNDDRVRTNMTITGTLNPDDDTIFLKVQTADKDGSARNIYFPFDIVTDTPIDVAMEMVKELEITDWEPFEIADMIDGEICALVPQWKKWDMPQQHHFTFDYQEEDGGLNHPFPAFSSCSSSQASFRCSSTSNRLNTIAQGGDWLKDDMFDDTSSEGSAQSGKYSNLNYFSCNEHGSETSTSRREQHLAVKTQKSTRFCPEENSGTRKLLPGKSNKQCKVLPDNLRAPSSKDKLPVGNARLTRNRSLVDVRSQLLHRTLVEEVHKRRLFKTVGAVENIGFQEPCNVSGKVSQKPTGTHSARTTRDVKGQGSQKKKIMKPQLP